LDASQTERTTSSRRDPTVESARYFRSTALPGVEMLHARFVTHRHGAHLHESWTVGAVDVGAVGFELEGRRHTALEGSVFLVPPYAVHSAWSAKPSGYRYRVAYLDPELFPPELDHDLTPGPTGSPAVLASELLRRDLDRLHTVVELPGRALEQGETLNSVTGALAGALTGSAGSAAPMSRRTGPRFTTRVACAVDYIHEHWREDFSIGDLARTTDTSCYHLIRSFHQQVGTSPSRYRRALRVLAAQRLLRAGRPVRDVACECGFYDQPHLNRHFKALIGVTPLQFARAD
jgi:AraC-like DNA-binding protein